MSDAVPISLVHLGAGKFEAAGKHWAALADRHYGQGEVCRLVPHEERSINSHSHYFAALAEAWHNLPDELAIQFPSVDALRKYALIRTGHCDSRSVTCSSVEEARKIVGFIKAFDQYAVVDIKGDVITHYTARSQSYRAMNKAGFRQSKDDALSFVSQLIGTTKEALIANGNKSGDGKR